MEIIANKYFFMSVPFEYKELHVKRHVKILFLNTDLFMSVPFEYKELHVNRHVKILFLNTDLFYFLVIPLAVYKRAEQGQS